MTKVYVLCYDDSYDLSYPDGIFTSKEKAISFWEKRYKNKWYTKAGYKTKAAENYIIEEYILDEE